MSFGTVDRFSFSQWDGTSEGLAEVSKRWRSLADRDHIVGTVTVFDPEKPFGPETQDRMAEDWNGDAKRVDIDRIGYVSEGIEGRAVSANLDLDCEVRTFSNLEAAIEWVRDAA